MNKIIYKLEFFFFQRRGLTEKDYIAYREFKAIYHAECKQSKKRFDDSWNYYLNITKLLQQGYRELEKLKREPSN